MYNPGITGDNNFQKQTRRPVRTQPMQANASSSDNSVWIVPNHNTPCHVSPEGYAYHASSIIFVCFGTVWMVPKKGCQPLHFWGIFRINLCFVLVKCTSCLQSLDPTLFSPFFNSWVLEIYQCQHYFFIYFIYWCSCYSVLAACFGCYLCSIEYFFHTTCALVRQVFCCHTNKLLTLCNE